MARGSTTSSLLMLSLEALLLLVAGFSAAATSGDTDIIIARVPTGGVADLVTAMASAITHDGEERPWECCDMAVCTRSFPPTCRCLDVVDQCSSACKQCRGDGGLAPHLRRLVPYRCWREHPQVPPWRSTTSDQGRRRREEAVEMLQHGHLHPVVSSHLLLHGQGEAVRQHLRAEQCEQVEGPQEVYRCLDVYRGEPGPRCEEDEEEKWAPAVASAHRFFLARKE